MGDGRTTRLRVLFVCSRNQWRSPTAEDLYRNDSRMEVRSGGVSRAARRQVTEKLLQWADLVLVMEHAHKRRLCEQFPDLAREAHIEVLDIPDDYTAMHPDLIDLLRARIEPLLPTQ
jgi:predicted protein tyrosine phosphatase